MIRDCRLRRDKDTEECFGGSICTRTLHSGRNEVQGLFSRCSRVDLKMTKLKTCKEPSANVDRRGSCVWGDGDLGGRSMMLVSVAVVDGGGG